MNNKCSRVLRLIGLIAILQLGACTSIPPEELPPAESQAVVSALSYYQSLQRMPLAEMSRERTLHAAQPALPGSQLRLAMLLGHPRGTREIGRALGLLDNLLKSAEPAALPLHSLARVLADNYNERLKLDGQLDKQGALLGESQRKSAELQEKLDGLADIERTLPVRARGQRPALPAGAK